ncbi:MAG: PRC-barrel domain containing protein [Cypionkella sp.]
MDHAHHSRLGPHELTPEILRGATIYGANEQVVGHVSHLHGSGAACQVIIDVGGFLGVGARPVVVGLGQLEFVRGPNRDVRALTDWSRAQLQAMPTHQD